ncbi:MAG: hypothetical protein QM813_13205 [Verrucomicrobiota bacterium]
MKYFEECGGAHYDGECFVFDQRVGLDPSLQETDSTQCFRCQTPLCEADQKDERYVAGAIVPVLFQNTCRADDGDDRNEARSHRASNVAYAGQYAV